MRIKPTNEQKLIDKWTAERLKRAAAVRFALKALREVRQWLVLHSTVADPNNPNKADTPIAAVDAAIAKLEALK